MIKTFEQMDDYDKFKEQELEKENMHHSIENFH